MASIAIAPNVTLTEKQHYGSQLLAGILDVLISLGRKGVILETIVARSIAPDGIRLMRGIGFTEIPSITRRRNFIIEVEKSGLKEIIQYKQALQESDASDEVKSRYKAPPHCFLFLAIRSPQRNKPQLYLAGARRCCKGAEE